MGTNTWKTTKTHVEEVHAWLRENVLKYKNVSAVTLFCFEIPESKRQGEYSGRFKVKFDQTECPRDFTFSIGDDAVGKPHFYYPIFHSPLGSPASYGAVEMPKAADEAIRKALNTIFPSVKPLGLDSQTGQVITMLTKHIDRVRDHDAMNAALARAKATGFEFTQPVEAT